MKPPHLMTPESFFGFRLHLLVDPSALMAWTSNSMIIPPKTYTHWITIALWTNIPVSSHYYSTVVFPWFSHDFPTLLPLVFKQTAPLRPGTASVSFPPKSAKVTWGSIGDTFELRPLKPPIRIIYIYTYHIYIYHISYRLYIIRISYRSYIMHRSYSSHIIHIWWCSDIYIYIILFRLVYIYNYTYH